MRFLTRRPLPLPPPRLLTHPPFLRRTLASSTPDSSVRAARREKARQRETHTLDSLPTTYAPLKRPRGVLLQGLLQPTPTPNTPDAATPPSLPPIAPLAPEGTKRFPAVMSQALENMEKLGPECVLLTRVGGFYELYFSHAEVWAERLGLKLGWKKTVAGDVAMAGFPFWQLEKFLKMLVQQEGRYVAICEEFAKVDGDVGGVEGLQFDRRIARIVTPGTLIDEGWIEGGENHFLLAVEIREGEEEAGMAWADLGTGEVWCGGVPVDGLAAELGRIGPREVVVRGEEAERVVGKDLGNLATWVVSRFDKQTEEVVEPEVMEVLKADPDALTRNEVIASQRLLEYIEYRLPGIDVKMLPPVRRKTDEVMGIDVNSLRGLEIKATLRDGLLKGSLMHTVNRTVTRGGRRLLGNRLTSPSTDIVVINQRLDLVETFVGNDALREELVAMLKNTHDSQRILQRFALSRADANDLMSLARTIQATQEIADRLRFENSKVLAEMVDRIDVPSQLAKRILDSIDEEGMWARQNEVANVAATAVEMEDPEEVSEAEQAIEGLIEEVVEAGAGKKRGRKKRISRGIMNAINKDFADSEADVSWIMKKNASPQLLKAHKRLQALREAKGHLEVHIRNKLNAQSLTLKWGPQLGHYCHVKNKDCHISGVTTVSSSRTTRSFLHPEWSKLGENINNVRLLIRAEEKAVFQQLLQAVNSHIERLRGNAAVLDELDVATAFALLAREQNLTRPIMSTGTKHVVVGGRHITVEAGLREQGQQFVGNDCFLGDAERLWLITGPNMAGKSTFLRQNALICILAQSGSFVPATHAELGIVDRLFSRIGSADNVFAAQSTFMVEMLETAAILRGATHRSFVIMDEVGRGTSPRDGAAVAYAVLMHLLARRCRTLFASHFHELAAWAEREKGVGMYCTDIQELEEGAWAFVHKLRKGVNLLSHAVRVAQMAGLPGEVVEVARRVAEEGGVKKRRAPRKVVVPVEEVKQVVEAEG